MSSSRTTRAAHGDSGGSDPALGRLKAVLGGWRSSLLDLGGRNRLLNFRHTRTATLEITAPDADAVLSGFARGWPFAPIVSGENEGSEAGEADALGVLTVRDFPSAAVRPGAGRAW